MTSSEEKFEQEIKSLKEENRILHSQEFKHSADLKSAQKDNINIDNFIESLKKDLSVSREKIEDLSKGIGIYEGREEFSEKNTSDKDKEIISFKAQIQDLLITVQEIKTQTEKESSQRILELEIQLKGYSQEQSELKENHETQINSLEERQREEIMTLKEKINSSTIVDTIQIGNMKKLLKEKDSLLESTQKSYQSLLQTKSDNIETLNVKLGKIKESKSEISRKLGLTEEENRLLVDRFKEEMQSVLSLKSAYTSEDKLASREELNENMEILSEFFDDPYSKTLKKIFKLKRVRKEDSSVDSTSLIQQNHYNEVREYEEVHNEENIEKVNERDVNEGRVEDMAQPGGRPQPLRGNRGRGRGGNVNRGRGGGMMPPRPNAPKAPQKSIPSKTNRRAEQNISILDPTSKF